MIRSYQSTDLAPLLHLVQLNTPTYFHPSEKQDYKLYLEEEREDYFVVEQENKIIGAGGINYFKDAQLARISWDVLHPNYQKKGIGGKLLRHRIMHVKKQPAFHTIEVRTAQGVCQFYEKFGFQLIKIEKDYWAKGYHLYQMQQKLV